jgi:hypothetical protein
MDARVRSVVAFLALAVGATVARAVTTHLRRRRERAQAEMAVPWNVLLRQPIWSRASDGMPVLAAGAFVAATVAALGFAGVAVGMAGTVAIVGVLMLWITSRLEARALTFTPDGLRVHQRGVEFLLRWNNIDGVERTGANDHVVELTLLSRSEAASSAVPPTEQARRRVTNCLYDGDGPTGRYRLSEWTGGLAAATLVRAIREGAAQRGRAAAN